MARQKTPNSAEQQPTRAHGERHRRGRQYLGSTGDTELMGAGSIICSAKALRGKNTWFKTQTQGSPQPYIMNHHVNSDTERFKISCNLSLRFGLL